MPEFHHNRLIVYRKSIDFVGVMAGVIPTIEPMYGFLRNQLGRAATSISLNIAEGSAEIKAAEKRRIYRIARRSACECAAILDVLEVIGYRTLDQVEAGRALLHEIVAMLTVMAKQPPKPARESNKRARE